MNYQAAPEQPCIELETLIHRSLSLDPRKPLNKLNNHCFSTLNKEAKLFFTTGFYNFYQATEETINQLGLQDLNLFMQECQQ